MSEDSGDRNDEHVERAVGAMVLNGGPLGILALGADLRITYANDVGAAFAGINASELIGRSALEVVHPDDHLMVAGSLGFVAEGREVIPTIFRVQDDLPAHGTLRRTCAVTPPRRCAPANRSDL